MRDRQRRTAQPTTRLLEKTDAVFAGTTAEATQGKRAHQCMTVVSNSPGQVVCDLKMGAFQSAMVQVLIGDSYSTTPRRLTRFTIVNIGQDRTSAIRFTNA